MTDRSWDPIEDLFGDSNDVASNSFTATDSDDKLFNEDELDQNELLGIEEDQQNNKDNDDFGLDVNKPPSVAAETAASPASIKAEEKNNEPQKSPESTGKNSAEAFFEEELEKIGSANIYTDLNYEEPDYDNLLDYDEEDDLDIDVKHKPTKVKNEQPEVEPMVVEKTVVQTPPKEDNIKADVSVKEPEIVKTCENIKVEISPVKKNEKLVKPGEIDEDDLEDEDEDGDGVKKKRGRSNHWSERAESSSPSKETETTAVLGNQNFKGYNNHRNNNNNNNRPGYQNGLNNRFNNNGNMRNNNYQPNNFNNISHYNNNVNKFQLPGVMQNGQQQNNALLPAPNMSNFSSNSQNQLIKPFNQPTSFQMNQFSSNSLINNQLPLNVNDKFRGVGPIQNFNSNLPQQLPPGPNVPPMNNQQVFNPNFNCQHIRPGFNQQLTIPNSNFINSRTDLQIPPHHVSPVINKNFNSQTNMSTNQFQNFQPNSPVNRIPNVANFNQPGLLPTPLVTSPTQFQHHMYQQQPNPNPINTYNNSGPSPQFNANQAQSQGQFIQPNMNMISPFPQVSQPLAQQHQQQPQQQIKPSTVYINPSFIAKQKKLEEEKSRQEVLKEMSFQNKANPKPQRSRKELEALLEKRLADEMDISNEKPAKSKSNSNIITPSSSSSKRKSYENSNDRKSSSSQSRIDPSDKLSSSTSSSKYSSPPTKKLMSKVVPQPKPSTASVESTVIVDDPEYAKKIEEQKRKREEILRMKEEKRNQRIKEASSTANKTDNQQRHNVNSSAVPVRDTRSVVVSTKSTNLAKRVVSTKPVVIS